ncbi:MAG: TolC family protein [Deltaproteobacteria bacterium]|nr:MAG: TolC family protein [Deltaproteobacteria bacterium]
MSSIIPSIRFGVGVIIVLLQLMIVRPGVAGWTETSAKHLSLAEAIQTAVAKNPTIAAVQSQLEVSDARIDQARSGLLPQLDFSEDFTRTTSPTGVFSAKLNQGTFTQQDFDVNTLNNPDPINNFATNFNLTVPVFNSRQTWIGFNQAKLNHEAVNSAMVRTRQQVIAATVFAYTGVQLAQENVLVVEQALQTARAHLDLAASRLRSGLVVKSDLLRAEVRVAELEQERLQAQSQLEIAGASLNATMGLEIDQVFRLTTPLEQGPELPGSLSEWTRKALQHRPDLAQVNYRQELAQKEVTKTKSAHLPSLFLSGNYQINTEDFSKTADNYTVGAVLSLNLFSGYNLQSRVSEARANLRQVQAMRQQLKLGIAVETKQAFLQTQSALQRIRVAQGAVAQAEEGLRIVRNRYEIGLYTIVNLLDAEVALQRARTNYSRSLHDHSVARAKLALAAGTLDENFR